MEARRVSVGLEQSIKSDHFIWLLITGVALLSSDAPLIMRGTGGVRLR